MTLRYDIPHLISFVSPEDSSWILIIDLYGNPRTVAGPQGRYDRGNPQQSSMRSRDSQAAICGCGRHYAGVRDGAYIPRGLT